MYVSIRVFRVKPGTREKAIEKTFESCKEAVADYPGFLRQTIVKTGKNEFVTLGYYENEEVALAAFKVANDAFWPAVSPYFDGETIRYHGDTETWTPSDLINTK